MAQDDRFIDPERLDETKPERNERSWWDRLRGEKETDEEKLRKKLDAELKEAARKRAEQFEEEQRAEERREVAETRKLKKRWRKKLVEKSERILAEAEEHDDEPKNGLEIAKLMVAERIVQLHTMLVNEDLRRSEIKALKIHIDFMGLLSEKIDRPELEVPEEVERLYQTIAEFVEETTGETINEPASEEFETPEEAPPISEADAAYNQFAARIVQAIKRVVIESGNSGHGAPAAPSSETLSPTRSPRANPNTTEQPSPAIESLLETVKTSALPTELVKEELFRTETARRLADIVEKAEVIAASQAVPMSRLAPAAREMQHAHPLTPEAPPIEKRHTSADIRRAPEKKVKHMNEVELLSLAKNVEVVHGWTLADLYRKGEIDKEGLVKVLEKYKKGRDYRGEFTKQRTKYRLSREGFPEVLSRQHAQDPSTSNHKNETKEKDPDSENSHYVMPHMPQPSRNPSPSAAQSSPGKLRKIGQARKAISDGLKRPILRRTDSPQKQAIAIALVFTVLLLCVLLLISLSVNRR